MNENLTQQFANFVQKNAPQNAEAILTDTSSPEIAAQREQLAREFVKQQVEPKVDEAYQEGRRNIGANMPSVSEGKGSGTVYADYNSHGDSIDEMTKNAGIKMMFTNRLNTCLAKTSKLIRIGKIAYISRRMMFRMNTLV